MAKAPSLEDILARVPKPLRCKLDQRLDEGHEGVSRHLGYIAQNIPEWEGRVADQLGLTEVNIRDIKFGPARDQQEMQRSVRYVRTYTLMCTCNKTEWSRVHSPGRARMPCALSRR